jgi:hypothetical protein
VGDPDPELVVEVAPDVFPEVDFALLLPQDASNIVVATATTIARTGTRNGPRMVPPARAVPRLTTAGR